MDYPVNVMDGKEIKSSRPYFPPEDIPAILEQIKQALETGQILAGEQVEQLEREFASYIGASHAIAVSSGTAALEVIFRYYDVGGGEVLVPTNSFVASANAIIFAGGTPVLADTSPEHLCVDFADLAGKVGNKTKAVEIVHLGGMIHPEIFQIRKWCKERGLILVEDAAHAHGASMNGVKAGALGDAAAFSFYPTKVLAGGEGGIITTNDEKLAGFARSIRFHGIDATRLSVRLGYNWRMHEFAAVLIRRQMSHLEDFVRQRNDLAARYFDGLSAHTSIQLILPPPHGRHSFYKFPVILSSVEEREKLKQALKDRHGVETGSLYYPPIHLQPYYREMMPDLDLPKSEVLKRVLCLPMHCGLSAEDVKYIVCSVEKEL